MSPSVLTPARRCPGCNSLLRDHESRCESCDIDVPAAIGIAVARLCETTDPMIAAIEQRKVEVWAQQVVA